MKDGKISKEAYWNREEGHFFDGQAQMIQVAENTTT